MRTWLSSEHEALMVSISDNIVKERQRIVNRIPAYRNSVSFRYKFGIADAATTVIEFVSKI